MIWSSAPAPYQDGKIRVELPIPKDAARGTMTLRIYAWDPESGQDMAAAGPLAVQRPQLALERIVIDPGKGAAVDVSNAGRVPARGELEVYALDSQTSRSLARESISLAPGERRKFSVAVDATVTSRGPVVIEADVRLPEPPDDPSVPQVLRKREALAIPAGWRGWVQPLCSIEERAAESAVVRVSAALPTGSGEWAAVLRTADNQMLTTQPLKAELDPAILAGDPKPAANVSSAAFVLDRLQYATMRRNGIIALSPVAPRAGAAKEEQALLAFGKLARRRSRLDIVPGSLRYHPLHPSEGETVFVDLEVENSGNMEADPAMAELLTRPPQTGE